MVTELYYPSFEITDMNWLKYALLYKKKVQTIVPINYQEDLSDNYKKIMEETNLLSMRDINMENWKTIANTTKMVKDFLTKVKLSPESYPISVSYYKRYENLDVVLTKSIKRYTIVNEKMDKDFKKFLVENNYAVEIERGVNVSLVLGYLYMFILTTELSEIEQNILPTTSQEQYSMMNSILRNCFGIETTKFQNNRNEVNKKIIIKQLIPKLDDLSIDDVIQIRNDKRYTECIESYNNVIERIVTIRKEDIINLDILNRELDIYSETMKDVRKDLLVTGGRLVLEVGTSLYLQNLAPLIVGELGKIVYSNKFDNKIVDSSLNDLSLNDLYRTRRMVSNLKKFKIKEY